MRFTPADTQFPLLLQKTLHLALLLVLLLPLWAFAQGDDADPSQRGLSAFEAGDYARAAELFEQALAEEGVTESLLYNLAVAWFREGRLDRAQARFEELLPISDSPALIHYNLGLVALEQDRTEAARAHFSDALVMDRDGRVAGLAGQQLERLGVERRYSSRVPWRGFIQAGGGYEDNLNLAGDRRAEAASAFQEAYAWGRGAFWRRDALTLSTSGLASFRHYSGYDGVDQGVLVPGLNLDYRWSSAITASVDTSLEWQWLDDERVYRRTESTLGLGWRQPDGVLELEAGRAAVSAGDGFAELDGHDLFAEVDYRRRLPGDMTALAGYTWTEEDREGLAFEDDFYSTSPVRHRLEATLRFPPVADWTLSAGAVWRLSRYQEAEVRAGSRRSRRREERWRLRLGADWQLHPDWRLTLGAEWESNHARLEDRDYRRMEARVGLRRAFGR